MNILVESQFFYPEQMRINDICASLVERGHSVTVVTSIPNYPQGKFYLGYGFFKKRRELYKGVSILHMPVVPRGKGFLGLSFNYISFVVSGWFFAQFSSLRPDVVFMNMSSPMTQSLVGTWFARKRKIPSLIYILDLWPESFEVITGISTPIILHPLGKMVDTIYTKVDKILTSSQSFIESIHARGVPLEKLEFWPQYAEDFYKPFIVTDSNVEPTIPQDDRLKIIFTGNIGLAQGLDLLISVGELLQANRIPVCFVLVGDGSYKSSLITAVQSQSLEEYFLFFDRQPAEQIPALLAQADAGLVILKKSEIFSKTIPAKVQSYMACSLPLIVSADGEVQKIVDEANAGVCAPAEDSIALVEAITSFTKLGKVKRKTLGNNARIYSEKTFNKNKLIDRLEVVLETLIKESTHVC